MTSASKHQSLELPILVSDPLWLSERRGYITTLTRDVSSYQHTITNTHGYDKASFRLDSNLVSAEDWLLNGLGRHIIVKNESLVTIFEAFVNKINFKVGSVIITVGPLLEVGNEISVTFSTVDTSTSPPTVGIRETTSVATDTTSQGLYGIIERIYSQGGSTTIVAEQVRDKYLEATKDPPTNSDDNFAQTNQPSVKVDCLGYYYWLDAYLYANSGTGTQNANTKLENILTADVNSIFSTDYSGIETNTLQVPLEEEGKDKARTILEDIVTMGNASNQRYNFMVLKDRKVTYEAVVEEIELIYRVQERVKTIEDKVGNRLKPWNVLPGKWRRTPDIFVGRTVPTDIKKDLRNSFITQVHFRAPDDLRFTGNELEDLPQLLGQIAGGVNVAG